MVGKYGSAATAGTAPARQKSSPARIEDIAVLYHTAQAGARLTESAENQERGWDWQFCHGCRFAPMHQSLQPAAKARREALGGISLGNSRAMGCSPGIGKRLATARGESFRESIRFDSPVVWPTLQRSFQSSWYC